MEVYGGGKVFGVVIKLSELLMMKEVLSIDEGENIAERASLPAEQVLKALFMEGYVFRVIKCGGKLTIVLDIKAEGDDLEPRRLAVEAMKFFSVRANTPFNRSILRFV